MGAPHRFSRDRFICIFGNVNEMGPNLNKFLRVPSSSITLYYRTKMNINPSFMKEIFVEREIHYNIRVMNSVYARKPKTTAYGLETISFLGQNLWRDLPLHIKKSQFLKRFKKHIKVWNFIRNCRLRKSFVVNVGYI